MENGGLAWTAERYVLGELPEAEAGLFEHQLADDQAAREAVADAVRLINAASTIPLVPVISRRPFPVAWIGAAVAACALIAIAIVSYPRSPQFANATRQTPIGGAPTDRDDWILSLPEVLQDQAAMNEIDDQPATADDSSVLIQAAADESDDELPAWLILVTSGKEGSS